MKNLLKTTVCFTTMSLTAILLPMNVMANEGEAKTITIAWTNIMESQQEIWEKYIFEPFIVVQLSRQKSKLFIMN